jgi:uncharacterized membrane protein YccC
MDTPLVRLRHWLTAHRADLRLAVRVTVAGALAYLLAETYHLPQAYWAVITAILVTQSSVGGSVAIGVDRIIGTIGGVLYVALVILVMPRDTMLHIALAIMVTLFPMALLAAVRAPFRVAPVTAIIILIAPTTGVSPFHSAIDRVLEIVFGTLVGVAVSLLVFPARAHALVAEGAAKTLNLFAGLLTALLENKSGEAETAAIHASIRASVGRVETLAAEAKRERDSRLTAAADPDPIARTLRRLRGDIVMVGRAVTTPMPENILARLTPAMDAVVQAMADFLTSSAAALIARNGPPSQTRVEDAMKLYATAVADLRRDGVLRELSGDQVSRIFTLGFAFDQMRLNFRDLADRVSEFRKT